jgi:TonB family protein
LVELVSVARPSHRRPNSARALGLGLAVAVGVHVAVVGTVQALHAPSAHGLLAGADGKADLGSLEPEVLLESSCVGDAALSAAARATSCLAPWSDGADACLAAARAAFAAERERCRTSADPLALDVVSMTAEEIARIDPEPLLELLDAAAQLKLEQQQAQQLAELQKQEQQRQQQITRQQQVVETAKPTVEVAPDHARFVSEYDTKVEKETVSRGSRHEPMVAKSRPEDLPTKVAARDPSTAQPPPDRPIGANEQAPDAPGKLSMRSPGALSPSRSAEDAKVRGRYDGVDGPQGDGTRPQNGDGSIERDRREATEVSGGGGAGGGAPAVPDLKASEDVLERVLGGGSVDHLDAVDSGDETALNAKRWVYASFFNRLKRQVAQNWEPTGVWRRHDPSGSVYGFKSRVTQLRVSLDGNGKLAKAPTVVHASGVDVLDEEAVRAFEAAAPFPNPPGGLVQADGQITFEFSFHFAIGAPRTSWRILRQM